MKKNIKKIVLKIKKYYYLPRKKMTLKRLFALIELPYPKKYKKYKNNYVSLVSMNIKRKSFPLGTVLFQEIYDEEDPQKVYDKAKQLGISFCILTGKINDTTTNKIPYVVVKKPHKYFVRYSALVKKTKSPITIAVTGSVGKTSAKQFISAVLTSKYNIKENIGNMNLRAHVGAYCQTLNKKYRFYLQETGGCIPNMVRDCGKILNPDCFIVTNIGNSHIENYKTLDNLIKDKLSMDKYLKKSGIAILNFDDKNIVDNCQNFKHKIISYGIKNKNVDYYAKSIKQNNDFLEVEITSKEETTILKAKVLGKHNAYNILIAYIVGKYYKMTNKEIQKGLLNYETSGIRQNLISISNKLLFVDCFNAAYNSVATALETVKSLKIKKNDRKIAVLGDILEMGEESKNIHTKIGKLIEKNNIDILITFGTDSKYIASNLSKKIQHFHIEKNKYTELTNLLIKITKPNDLILFKSSHSMYLSLAIDRAFGTSFYSREKEKHKKTLNSPELEYKLFNKELDIIKYKENKKLIIIPDSYENNKIVRINSNAFKNLKATSITVGRYLRTILENAITELENLEELHLENCKNIKSSAINNCQNLKKIYIKNKFCNLEEDFIDNCPNVELIIPKDFIMIDIIKNKKIKYSFFND